MSIPIAIPKTAVVLPSNVRVQSAGGTLILQKIKRRTKRFKTTKAQRASLRAAARKFKVPLLTSIAVGPAVLFSVKDAMLDSTLIGQLQRFLLSMLSFYTGIVISGDANLITFEPRRLAVGWGPIVAIGVGKSVMKGRIMAINRALSRAQIPANLS